MANKIPDMQIRGIRQTLPSGYLLGRTAPGNGPAHLVPLSDLRGATGASGGGGTGGLPVGGSAGQVLTKNSATDYDAGWAAQNSPYYLEMTRIASSPSFSTSAYAFKGNIFIPRFSTLVYGLGMNINTVVGAHYKGMIAALSGTGSTGLTIAGSPSFTSEVITSDAVGQVIYAPFSNPVTLTPGTAYALMFGRTDGGDTYAFPGGAPSGVQPLIPGRFTFLARVAKAAPASGDAVDTNAASLPTMAMAYRVSF